MTPAREVQTTSTRSAPGEGLIQPDTSAEGLRKLTDTLAETAAEADRTGQPSAEAIQAVHEAGLLTATVGSQFGGPAISATSFVDIFTAMGAGDPAVALIALMTSTQHFTTAHEFKWPDGVYEQILSESATRPVLLNAARDEPRLGSFARGGKLATTVRRSETGWIVDGHKAFVTGAGVLSYYLLLVSEETTGQIGRVIVPADSPGISITNNWDAVGMRASLTHNVTYEGVEVPLGNFVPLDAELAPNRALIEAMFMIGLSAIYLGVARSARDELVRFLHERVPASLGAPLATVERLQDATGEVTAQLQISETMLYEAARRIDQGVDPRDPLIASVKLHCTRASVRAVELAVQAAGSHGISAAAPLERHLRDVLCARLHPTPDDMLLRKLGNASLETERWPN